MERGERSKIPFVRLVQNIRVIHATLSGNPELVGKLVDRFGMSDEDRIEYAQDATSIRYELDLKKVTPRKSIEH